LSVDALTHWIADNNGLLSGLVSLIALVGIVASPLGRGLRRLSGRGQQREEPPRAATTPAVSGEPLIAVLAFDNLSSDGEMQFFSDGISEEIIQHLSRGAKLRVIGRTSSFEFRGERKADAARSLACTHVLDGSIRRAGDRVRITAHLVEASSRTTLWTDRYDRGLADIFAVQDEISESIAAALDRAFASTAAPAIEPAVYDAYLRARPASFAPDELRRHIDALEDVTRRAPAFGEAWGRLAYLRAWWHFYQPFADRPAIACARRR
jgi:TolB-like protein